RQGSPVCVPGSKDTCRGPDPAQFAGSGAARIRPTDVFQESPGVRGVDLMRTPNEIVEVENRCLPECRQLFDERAEVRRVDDPLRRTAEVPDRPTRIEVLHGMTAGFEQRRREKPTLEPVWGGRRA